jgi:tRNA (cytosine34-C5)-methyltransferase
VIAQFRVLYNNTPQHCLPHPACLFGLRNRCYYALQGLHDHRFAGEDDDAAASLVSCQNDAERQQERRKWRTALGTVLPSSFRIGRDVPAYLQASLTSEFDAMLREAEEYIPIDEAAAASNDGPSVEETGEEKKTKKTASSSSSLDPLDEISVQKIPFVPTPAYQLNLDRKTIRKNPALQKVHAWLKQHAEAGHITRQETVSMLPPVLLKVAHTDAVLDMCAAPGSKTSQLLEDLSFGNAASSSKNGSSSTGGTPDSGAGVLVANDASSQRANMLVHQLRRILHHHPVALITATPAQYFPALIQFDKILCDVPCTGDGTSRKNINVWRNWTNSGALALHALQLSIAKKGACELLKVGGVMCYSTCSMNPVENEAVVAELLRQCDGCLELLEVNSTELLQGFRTRPGMETWKVLSELSSRRERRNEEKKNNVKMQARRKAYEEKEEGTEAVADDADTKSDSAEARTGENAGDADVNMDDTTVNESKKEKNAEHKKFQPSSLSDEKELLKLAEGAGLVHFPTLEDVPPGMTKRIRKTLFPPTPQEAAKFHLDRCLRCLPHDNNTGGFFVALLRKTAPVSVRERKRAAAEAAPSEPDAKSAKVDEESEAAEERNNNEEDGEEEDLALDEDLDPDNKPIRGQVKGNLIKGSDVGKDDFASLKDDVMASIIEFYGLANGFDPRLYMARAASDAKIIYYIAKPVRELFVAGLQERVTSKCLPFFCLLCFIFKRAHFISVINEGLLFLNLVVVGSGLKGFERNSRNKDVCPTPYRICQEGIHFLAPYMTKRKFIVNTEDFKLCLTVGNTMLLSRFSQEFQDQTKDLSTGSFLVVLKGFDDKPEKEFLATMWKCRGASVDGLVTKKDVDIILRKVAEIEKQR